MKDPMPITDHFRLSTQGSVIAIALVFSSLGIAVFAPSSTAFAAIAGVAAGLGAGCFALPHANIWVPKEHSEENQ